MDGNIIAILYGIILVLFFVLLVTLTITLIISKSKGKKEEYEEDYEYDEYESFSDSEDVSSERYDEEEQEIENIFDSAFASVQNETPMEMPTEIPTEIPTLDIHREIPAVQEEPEDVSEPVGVSDAVDVSEPEEPVETEEKETDTFADSAFSDSAFSDSAFGDSAFSDSAFGDSAFTDSALDNVVVPKKKIKSKVSSSDDFYWYNKMDVAEKPSYKTAEMYYHYFNIAKDCIEDLLIEMYDCALVRTEEIKYIAYGIAPRAVSMKEILTSGNRNYTTQTKLKEPTTEDRVKIYEKWCGYVDKLFEKVYIHADSYTIEEIRDLLYEFGKSDVDVLIEGM